jgi:quercetin dioxygenase-like cupin family protein
MRMKPQPFVINPKDYPKPLNVVGEQVTVLASGAATQGYEVFLQQGPEGSGPPPHAHPWDETFYVIGGVVELGFENKRLVAQPGTLVHIPAGTTHWFRLGKGGAEMLSITARLAASRLFADIAREIAPDKPDLDKLVGIAARYEVAVLA